MKPKNTSITTSRGGEDVSGKSAAKASDLYCKQEYVECNISRTPIDVSVEFPKNNAILDNVIKMISLRRCGKVAG